MLRRRFLSGLMTAPPAGLAASRTATTHKAKVVKLFKSPEGHPNGLEATEEGLWHLSRTHGLWCMHSNDYVIHKLDDGKILEVEELSHDDPDHHGMCLDKGTLYYCDAGIGPGATTNRSPWAGNVCRIELV